MSYRRLLFHCYFGHLTGFRLQGKFLVCEKFIFSRI